MSLFGSSDDSDPVGIDVEDEHEDRPEIISVPDAVDGRLRIVEDRDEEDHGAWMTGASVEVQP
jgi:hypothetical protein